MISGAEIKRIATGLGVDPRVVDHDYVLGCFLRFLALRPEIQASWIFKGGTSLSKCYFPGYRFSEDIDFTSVSPLSEEALTRIVNFASRQMQEVSGIRTDSREISVEVIPDDYGKESFEAKVYYYGPSDLGGSPRSIRVHLNADETIVFPVEKLPIFHAFSDNHDLPGATIPIYSLHEILVEKLRAFSGQRRFAIARDIFDIYHISTRVDPHPSLEMLETKCRAKGLSTAQIDLAALKSRKEEYKQNWEKNLKYLVPPVIWVRFEDAWVRSIQLLGLALRHVES